LPFQNNPLPFGEGDSAWHFSIGDYIHSSDKAIWRLPFYVGMWYYGFNEVLGPFALEYPPSNHMNYGLMQLFGEQFVSVSLYKAIASFLGMFAVIIPIIGLVIYPIVLIIFAVMAIIWNWKTYEAVGRYARPVLLSFVRCTGVLLDGPTFQNSPAWNLHPLMCEDLIIRNITVRNPWFSANGDGLDLESCKNAVVYNCSFDVGDDAMKTIKFRLFFYLFFIQLSC